MANAPQSLPTRFPCWCRATYSWGGESKRDLGFIEGDLIECLNAGDGSWWMGRLRRNKTTGLFPSNFVKVLDAGFQPVNRGTSPMASSNGTLSTPKATPQKSKTFRKPFQSYAQPSPVTKPVASANLLAVSPIASRQNSSQQNSKSPSRQPSYLQSHSSSPSRQASDQQNQFSPLKSPSRLQSDSSPTRQLSYISPTRQGTHLSRPSRQPSPVDQDPYLSRSPSLTPVPPQHKDLDLSEDNDSPPPPPPPHRIAYNAPSPRPAASPTPSMNDRYPAVSRGHSPIPHSPRPTGQTPSPLRDAMDDVMSSLNDMQLRRDEDSPSPELDETPLNPWSPEAFDEFRTKPKPGAKRRPRSSLGIASSQMEHSEYDNYKDSTHPQSHDEPPRLDDYVERMESRLRANGATSPRPPDEMFLPASNSPCPPAVPRKNSPLPSRPQSSYGPKSSVTPSTSSSQRLRARKSAYELGRHILDRTFTTKSSTTNSSSGIQSVSTNGTVSTDQTSQSLMSGHSAGGFSATSAASLARRKWGSISRSRPQSVVGIRQDTTGFGNNFNDMRPKTPSQPSSSQSRPASRGAQNFSEITVDCNGGLGGFVTPKSKKSGFFRKLVDSAKAGAASTRSTIADGRVESQRSPIKSLLPNGVTAIAGGSAARDMGLGGSKSDDDWVQVRRDVNRSNSISRNERMERIERCQMLSHSVIAPVDELLEAAEGDESADGYPVDQPTDYQSVNLQLVDKSARFINSLPPMTNAVSLAQGYVCRPYRSDVQRLRAIFTWVSEKVAWEEDFDGEVDTRRVIQMRRGCSEEVASLVHEMCNAVGLQAEMVRGYLKSPGETADSPRPNHWWNAVVVNGCWRIMDCSLASPTNPRRSSYSSAGSQVAEVGFFLARPMEICFTHIPSNFHQQHMCPLVPSEVLLALPCASPAYFSSGLQMVDYDTSLFRIENLELVQIQFMAPSDVECVAEVEARSYAHDVDGDRFESGDTTITRALAQAEWIDGHKRYTVKAHLPSDEGYGALKVYAGKRGLMHSVKDNPHPLAFTIPIIHKGDNPPYEFLLRHPTPHAQRHDLYVSQPQCRRLALNNTFVFAVRQHPSSMACISPMEQRASSPRPSSAMSMVSAAPSDYFSQTSSNSGNGGGGSASAQQGGGFKQEKPAKLAIQAPSGKINRLIRKSDNCVSSDEAADGGVWETIIKVGERGVWRGLVLADRSARWCVFGEWNCV